jgi:AraC family transcriptional regulator of adaptative response / DNA-3-methyladenine glycosylase II
MATHDARFDGVFFTAVTSTGIYCRPVCRVRIPRQANCRFFTFAAQAESQGFRPCLRCRPELAPGISHVPAWSTESASAILALQALQLLQERATNEDQGAEVTEARISAVQAVAKRLGISERHLRRIFETHLGVSPLQVVLTHRLLAAKQLLTDTTLAIAEVAAACGFGSQRRFNAAFLSRYGMSPSRLRPERGVRPALAFDSPSAGNAIAAAVELRLGYRPPYHVDAMMDFLAQHVVRGLEEVVVTPGGRLYRRTVSFVCDTDIRRSTLITGWLELRFDTMRHQVIVRIDEHLAPVMPVLLPRLRALLDLDCDPVAIDALLIAHFPGTAGMRVPGTLTGFELAVRAIIGQQITLKAAHTIAGRLVGQLGARCSTPFPALTRLFPTPQAFLAASSDLLGGLGVVRQRQTAIWALANAVSSGALRLEPGEPPEATMTALRALPGIGDWTAHYIALRALRWPDAFPAGDVALQKALGVRGDKRPALAATAAAQAWQPWRGYATLRAWTTSPVNRPDRVDNLLLNK